MGVESFIIHFGYIVIFLGTFFAGEALLVLAGFMAHRGFLDYPLVVLVAMIGAFTSDQLYYYLGRKKGLPYLDKHPSWKSKVERILKLMHRRQNLVILLFRFVYGVRSVTPFVIGVSGVSPLKFLALNITGALVWTVALTSLGYFFGHAAERMLDDIKKYEYVIMGVIVLVSLVLWLLHYAAGKRKERLKL